MYHDYSLPIIQCTHNTNRRYCTTCADPNERLHGCVVCGKLTMTRINVLVDDRGNTYSRTPGWLLCSIMCAFILKAEKDSAIKTKGGKPVGASA